MVTFGILPNDTFFYLHGFKLNANAWKILHPQNDYIFILILPWNKPILLWKQSNTIHFGLNPHAPDYTYLISL